MYTGINPVTGQLQAVGTEADSIYFTTDNQTTGWGVIRVVSDDICTLSYCRIEYGKTSGDYLDIHGGGLALLTSNAVVSNCLFANNDATRNDNGMGGAVYAFSTEESIFNDCIFTENHAYGEGGAIKFSADNYSELTGCQFIGNDCLSMAGYAEAYYCGLDMSCGATGTNSFYEDPQFVDPDNLDFNLLAASACINE